MSTINLKILVDGKQAIAELQLTDENIKELYKSFKYGKQEVNGLTTSISQGFNNAREILQGFNEVVNVFSRTFGKSIQLYGVQEKAEKQLQTALGYTSQALLDYASAMQRKTIHGDEEIIQAQSLIAAFVKEESEIKALTKASLDLADAKGMSLASAADLLAKSVASSTNAMSRYGIEIEGTAGSSERLKSAVDAVNKAFGGQAEALAETNIGSLDQFGNLIGDIQEDMGLFVTSAMKPVIEHLENLINGLNKINPQLTGFVATIASLTGAFVLLKTTGITRTVSELARLPSVLNRAKLASYTAGLSFNTLGVSIRSASTAVKGFFASLGPVGWAVLSITVLAEAMALFGDETEEATNKLDTLGAKSLEVLRAEKQALENKLNANKNLIESKEEEISRELSLHGKTTEYYQLLKDKQALEFDITMNKRKQSELTEEIAKKEKQIEASVKSRYETLKKQMEVDSAETGTEKNLIKLKQSYDADVANLQNALSLKIISAEQYEKDLLELTKNYNKKRSDELKKLPESASGLYSEIDKKIKELNNQKATAKTISEIAEIEIKIEELTRKKKHIKLQVDLEKSGGALDVSDLEPKGITDGGNQKEEREATKEEAEYLKNLQLNSIEDRFAREEAIREANLQADLQAYGVNEEAKTTIYEFYEKERERVSKASAMAQVQTSMNALGFIASAVDQYTVVGKAIAVAQATWNTYQAATAALGAQPWGPWNYALAAAVTYAGKVNVAKIIEAEPPKMKGYKYGGRFKKGEVGYIEGYYNEIIAPEKTFIEVFQKELRPQIYGSAPLSTSVASYSTKGLQEVLKSELSKFSKAIDDKEWRLKGEDIVTSSNRWNNKRSRNSFE